MQQAQPNHAELIPGAQRVSDVYENGSLASAHKSYLSGTVSTRIFAERSVTNTPMQRAENLIYEKNHETTRQCQPTVPLWTAGLNALFLSPFCSTLI